MPIGHHYQVANLNNTLKLMKKQEAKPLLQLTQLYRLLAHPYQSHYNINFQPKTISFAQSGWFYLPIESSCDKSYIRQE